MKKDKNKSETPPTKKTQPGDQFAYEPNDDIYARLQEEQDLDPEDPHKIKSRNTKPDELNELDFNDDVTGGDLDVPGSDLDDKQEDIGSEDEENNYYSLGDNK